MEKTTKIYIYNEVSFNNIRDKWTIHRIRDGTRDYNVKGNKPDSER